MTGGLIFLGPSLPAAEARALTDTPILPPAAQGDLYRAVLAHRPRVVGIVDGYFHQVPSVWHREILWAISEGVAVFGAASMGALRAAELDAFGMVGIGRVYKGFRAGRYGPFSDDFENDDEVAVVHGPPDTEFLRLSDAMVDLRQGLAEAHDLGVISAALRDALCAEMAATFYPDRSAEALLASPQLAPPVAAALRDWWEKAYVSQKRRDALALIARVEAFLASGETAPKPTFGFQRSGVWETFVAAEEARRAAALTPDDALVADDLQRDFVRWPVLCRAAGREGGPADPAVTWRAFASWRELRGLASRASLERWMAENGLDEAGLAALFERVARRGGAHVTAAGARDVVDHLRLSGAYPEALHQARLNAAVLAAAPDAGRPPPPDMRPIAWRYGLVDDDALAPEPLARVAERLCYPDEGAFARALWSRYHLDLAGSAKPGEQGMRSGG
ncbi:hypothetical protein GCM10007036_29300 [Alsobacter metallidurans]|uniref:TfuA-like core domain-containing protein n=1 Tax=Alsobacter metallidurans TaxID=340221 RepID=A0A917MID0_9HYPH|nr:TfuA-like protein [Alsobacter metallidurans]GGH23499.1 hypothetical protein GCM10007036_29300 [Alsobacter metallidurans]